MIPTCLRNIYDSWSPPKAYNIRHILMYNRNPFSTLCLMLPLVLCTNVQNIKERYEKVSFI